MGRDWRSGQYQAQVMVLDGGHVLNAFQNGPAPWSRFGGGLIRGDVADGVEEVAAAGFEDLAEAHEEQCIPKEMGRSEEPAAAARLAAQIDAAVA